MIYFNNTIINGIGQHELCRTFYSGRAGVCHESMYGQHNTATNKSCVSHQQVVINFIRDCNTYYAYDRISTTRESVFRLYFYRWRVKGEALASICMQFFIMLQRREYALLYSLLKAMHCKILFFDHIMKYSNIYLQITNYI